MPVPVGSHGETIAECCDQGSILEHYQSYFESCAKLEHQSASLGRFTSRRAIREQLHHVEAAIKAFVERELVSLLEKCSAWSSFPVKCSHVEASLIALLSN